MFDGKTWLWIDPKAQTTYLNWADGEGDTQGNQCMEFSYDDDYEWADVDCGNAGSYVCEISAAFPLIQCSNCFEKT